jgi:hypothetical protein
MASDAVLEIDLRLHSQPEEHPIKAYSLNDKRDACRRLNIIQNKMTFEFYFRNCVQMLGILYLA